MEYASSIFSLLFFSLLLIYFFGGIYIIKLNPKAKLNKLCLLMCISLSIWSLGLVMTNSANNINTVLLWRRFSVLGWTIMHSLTLHFLLLLTRDKIKPLKKTTIFFIHIPAIMNMCVFVFFYKISMEQSNLANTIYSWTNLTENNIYDWFFNVYYAMYIIIGLGIVWKWKNKFQDKEISHQANLIFVSLLTSFILGCLADIIARKIFTEPLAQISPIFILLPVTSIYYVASKHSLIGKEFLQKDEIILSNKDKKRIFKNISYAFFAGGILSFIFEYLTFKNEFSNHFQYALVRSGILFILGFAVHLSQKIKGDSKREAYTILILILSVPIINLQFLDYSGKTVWVFPIIIIISSLVFNKKTLLTLTTIVAIITQRLIWLLRPDSLVRVQSYDYITRMGLFILAYVIASYANNIYLSKIKENAYQIKFQKMNADLSFDLMNINQKNSKEKINNLLFKIGKFFAVDRASIFLIDPNREFITHHYEWCNSGIENCIDDIRKIPLEKFFWWINKIEEDKLVYIENINTMPEESISIKVEFIRRNTKSLISVPIEGDDKIQGFIVLESVKAFKFWSNENIKLLNILSNLIANGLIKLNSEKEIEFMAYYDSSTKLPNRFLFSDRVNQAISLAKRNESFVSIMFIDLDDFKSVNDTMGHSGGDLLLKQVGESLKKKVRQSDTVARFGGDEFMVMMNNIKNHEDISEIANKIMDIFSKPFNIEGQDIYITGSAGLATFPIDGEDSEELIKNADTAMYQAKSKGKNQYVLCTRDMREEIKLNMELSNDLYKALDNDELVVYYQPQIDLHTGKISGVEALLRWIHPEKGIISPGVFIPLAEKNSLINSIGEWVLKTSCKQNKKWQDMGYEHIKIAVNLSAIQFVIPNIIDDIERVLKETGLDPKYLELEITESIAIREASYAIYVLNRLKKLGVSIAIDDFGTEYSSLSRLKNLPIDRIKIDMQFIQGIENNEKDRAITTIIINLAKSLGLNVLAEGVETESQLEFLNQKMCNYVQGYYYYKPMPAHHMERILESTEKNKLEWSPDFKMV